MFEDKTEDAGDDEDEESGLADKDLLAKGSNGFKLVYNYSQIDAEAQKKIDALQEERNKELYGAAIVAEIGENKVKISEDAYNPCDLYLMEKIDNGELKDLLVFSSEAKEVAFDTNLNDTINAIEAEDRFVLDTIARKGLEPETVVECLKLYQNGVQEGGKSFIEVDSKVRNKAMLVIEDIGISDSMINDYISGPVFEDVYNEEANAKNE